VGFDEQIYYTARVDVIFVHLGIVRLDSSVRPRDVIRARMGSGFDDMEMIEIELGVGFSREHHTAFCYGGHRGGRGEFRGHCEKIVVQRIMGAD
jgi:hypothetical protein